MSVLNAAHSGQSALSASAAPTGSTATAVAGTSTHARDLQGKARSEALSRLTRLSEVNIVQFLGFTDADARRVQL
eukprot:373004-Pleurochrysis_carterae.AAC.2